MDLRNLRSRTRSGGAEQRNDSLPPALLAYLAQLDSLAERSTINVFWERQLGGFGSFPADLGRKDLRQRVETFYGFESLPDGVRSPKDDPRYSRTLQLGDRLRQYARHPKRGAVGANKVEFEHMRALDFLRRHD